MCALFILAMVSLAVPDRPDPTPKEPLPIGPLNQQLQGEWIMIDAKVGGQPDKIGGTGERILILKDDQMHLGLRNGGPSKFAYRFRFDPAQKPAAFDIVYINKKNAGALKSIACIIKIEGDILTLCYHRGKSTDRPTQFTSPANSQAVLWQFKRASK